MNISQFILNVFMRNENLINLQETLSWQQMFHTTTCTQQKKVPSSSGHKKS